jgi:hypothetical protein
MFLPTARLKLRTFLFVLGAAIAGWIAWTSPVRAAAGDSPFPVRVSANGRHLVDASGAPFLLHGDTAWSLIVQLTKEEAEEYLENRRQKGFNAILINLIEFYYADRLPKNKYGDASFMTPGDFPPERGVLRSHDWVIVKARRRNPGILNPCYTG